MAIINTSICNTVPALCLTWSSVFQYLTTVIPYEKKSGTPSVEDLQILTKSECLFVSKVLVFVTIFFLFASVRALFSNCNVLLSSCQSSTP